MNRKQRRNYIKQMNTPEKIENFSKEIDRKLRIEYEQKSERKIQEFIKCYTILFTYVLDYELETEKHIRIAGRKNKNLSKQISDIDAYFLDTMRKHLDLLDDGTISLEDIQKYFEEERSFKFDF